VQISSQGRASELPTGWLAPVITHDMSLPRRAGRIVEMRDGTIIADGAAT